MTVSQSSSNVKLSRAQVRCLETMEQGARPLSLSAIAETQRMNKLISFGLVDSRQGDYCPEYFLTFKGKHLLEDLNRAADEMLGTEPAPADRTREPLPRVRAYRKENAAEIMETTKRYLESNNQPADIEPAAPVIEEAPVVAPVDPNYTAGQTVLFRYSLSNLDAQLYQGVIRELKESTRWGKTALIEPFGNETHIAPRYVAIDSIKQVVTGDVQMPAMPQPITFEDVRRFERTWWDAQDANDDNEPIAHQTFRLAQQTFIDQEYARLMSPKNAPIPSDKGDLSPIQSVQVQSTTGAIETPEMPVSRDLSPTRMTGVVSYYNASKGYGYIKAGAHDFYFQTHNLEFVSAPIAKGSHVSFETRYGMGENAGRPRASVIRIDGYIAPERPTYQTPTAVRDAAHAAKKAANERRAQSRVFRAQRDERNAQAISQTLRPAK